MSLDNMTLEEAKFWMKGVADSLREVSENGLWVCPMCENLMGQQPNNYHICPHCLTVFGINGITDVGVLQVWKP